MPVSSAAAPRRPATACRVWAASRQHWCRPSGCELLSGSNALPWSDAERLSLASCPGTGVSVETLPGVLLRCRSSLCSLGCFPLGSFSSMGSPWPLLIVLPVPFGIHFYLLGFEFFQSVSSLATLPRPFRQHVFSVGLIHSFSLTVSHWFLPSPLFLVSDVSPRWLLVLAWLRPSSESFPPAWGVLALGP